MSKVTLRKIHAYILVSVGTIILAFGSVMFLTKCELVAGGASGIAIIVQHFVTYNIYDYVVAGLMVITWLLGLIFVGKIFALRTLYSSFLYILATFLFNRVPVFDQIANQIAGIEPIYESGVVTGYTQPEVGNLILCGIFGGVSVGTGVAITFIGGGSTGGVDVIQVILRKYLNIKESISCVVVDVAIIIAGMIAMRMWVPALCGILASVMTAILVDLIYIRHQTSYQVDIISEHWKEISQFAQDVLERGATIIHAEGGYKGEERIILRVVFDRTQYNKIREFIAMVDPNAFVTFTQTNAVYGEGFASNKKTKKNRQNKEK
ncbi:MAG: YitT family protein [Bacilli bacterium]|nr:YitT family protein [Bacilli bacterium]